MTFGTSGGSPKTIQVITDTGPFVQSFTNRDFYTCPLDTLAIITPLFYGAGTGTPAQLDTLTFLGITVKLTHPIDASIQRYQTHYGAAGPFALVGTYASLFLNPNTPDTNANFLYPQRYEKYVTMGNVSGSGGGISTALAGVGGGIILFPGEIVSWGSTNNQAHNAVHKLRYSLVEYPIAS